MKSRNANRPQWPRELPAPSSWIRQTSILPEETRESHQQYLDCLNRFCGNAAFRESIINLRRKYPPEYWNQVARLKRLSYRLNKELQLGVRKITNRFWEKHGDVPVVPAVTFTGGGRLRFEQEAEDLCSQCGLRERDERWIEWLVRNWDPSKAKTPPLAPPDIAPNFYPWRITVTDFFPQEHRRVTLELEEGASPKAARKAANRAAGELPATYRRHATSITDTEREQLHRAFKSEILNGQRPDKAYFRGLAERMSIDYWPISPATIRKEYFVFSGTQPRQYAGTASRDRRK